MIPKDDLLYQLVFFFFYIFELIIDEYTLYFDET